MEEGVVNEMLNGPLRDIFDCKQLITDVSGCGNNWYMQHLIPYARISNNHNLASIPIKPQFKTCLKAMFSHCHRAT